MADLFGRRAHASESSYSRDRDKEKLARLQEFLRKEGYHIPERPATAAASPAQPTVDVLAEISAHSLPLGKVRVTQVHSFEGPAAPDPTLPLPEMPSQSAVTAEIYRAHLGKGKWINTVGNAMVPHGEGGGAAAALSPAALFGGGAPLSPQEAARLERQAAASGGAAGALVVGSLVCLMGFAAAGAALWRWKGRPDREQVKQHLSTAMPERYSRLEVGPVGQAARSIASGAAASIPEHEGLKNLQAPDEYACSGCNPHCNPVHPAPRGSRCLTTPKLKTAWHRSGMRPTDHAHVYTGGAQAAVQPGVSSAPRGAARRRSK